MKIVSISTLLRLWFLNNKCYDEERFAIVASLFFLLFFIFKQMTNLQEAL